MPIVKIASETLLKVRERLVKVAAIEKRAEEMSRENDVLRRTLNLVAEGQIDPAVALEKVAEFNADPDALRAAEMVLSFGGPESTKLGAAVDAVSEDGVAEGGGTPEAQYAARLFNIVGSLS
jgi:hypothetical protein